MKDKLRKREKWETELKQESERKYSKTESHSREDRRHNRVE